MTPQQANDFGHLPEHPRPAARPDSISIRAAVVTVGVFLIVGFASGCTFGKETAAKTSKEDIAQAYRNGVVVGAICAHDPNLAACQPEEMERGGVL